jgi:ketosteroid isomerase-like protein
MGATSENAATMRRLLESLISGDTDELGALVADDVVGWSPNLLVTSRDELLDSVESRELAFSNIATSIDALDEVGGHKAVAEWHVAVDHTGPLVIDDDVVIEATGLRLHLAGATIAEFSGGKVSAFRSYFDDLAIIEQVLLAVAELEAEVEAIAELEADADADAE